MAIAGGAVPCAIFVLVDGELRDYYYMFANGDVVEDDITKAFDRIVKGETVHVHRYADNIPNLKSRIKRHLAYLASLQEDKGLRGDDVL